MYKTLSPGAIGVRASNLEEAIAAAQGGGFGGVEINPAEIAQRIEAQGLDSVAQIFAESGVVPAGFGLPLDWRGDEAKWQDSLKELPRLAHAAQQIGCTRTFTWIPPGSNTLDYAENRAFHIERFRPAAEILDDYGIDFGMEFLGPKTLRDPFKYPFIYKMGEMLDLGAEIGANVGILLDCWHWYTSESTVDELLALKPEQVVYVHVNDAPPNVPIEEHVDNVRELPGETGVIPIADFLQALKTIGYEGPVTPEPFKNDLANLADDASRVRVVGESMSKIFRLAHLE